MIGKLTGRVDSRGEDWAIIDVSGVGYLVHCGRRTLERLPAQGSIASLVIETQLREDRLQLLGFASGAERDWFRLLVTVQGVGARIALSLLSVLEPDDLARAVAAQDKALLTRADGVGPKLAQRIVNELKDKAAGLMLGQAARTSTMPAAAVEGGPAADAVSALVNLGYGRSEAFGAVASVAGGLGTKASVEALIKASLKELAR
ncbi:MAG: Holliday junction branch migration protein RuvA [Proteobacteria bacterium]|nr:Holliday junction branch migration protein RuvA [Pseudomonadota bacterium]MBI3496517.1 Holliday junction branch migration protein RuvA [Pseudomonadota bacterium]